MKIITPPAISNLEELLAVAMNPEKLTTALKQMSDMRNAVIEHLDAYTTKQKADEYLSDAQAKQAEAQSILDDASEKMRRYEARANERLDSLARDQDAWTKAKEIEQAALKARQDESDAYFDALAKKETSLNELELVIQQRTAELDKLSAKLTAELGKMEQRKALLNAV